MEGAFIEGSRAPLSTLLCAIFHGFHAHSHFVCCFFVNDNAEKNRFDEHTAGPSIKEPIELAEMIDREPQNVRNTKDYGKRTKIKCKIVVTYQFTICV